VKTSKKIETGIYEDQYGRRAIIEVGGISREKRYAFDIDLQVIREWRDSTRVELRLARPKGPRGTLAADVKQFLASATRQALAGFKAQRSELRAWVALYGTWNRGKLQKKQVLDARDTWTTAGIAPKTINHRVRSLTQLFHELDGEKVPTPCDEVKKLNVPKVLPVVVPEHVINQVALNLAPRPLEQARFIILTLTGIRQSQLRTTNPETQLDLAERVWLVQSGKKGNHIPVHLNDQMLAAFKRYVALDGFNAENWCEDSEYAKIVHAAGWPQQVRPYNARHSVGFALAEAGADHQDIADQMGHTNTKTTLEYVRLVKSRLKKNSDKLSGRGLKIDAALKAGKKTKPALTVKTGQVKKRLSRKILAGNPGTAKRTA